MAVLNEAIPRQGSNASASFDFRDLASGSGYETFYGVVQYFPASGQEPASLTLSSAFLIPVSDVVAFDNVNGRVTSTTTSAAINFETSEFNLPRTVKGNVIINFNCRNNAASTTNCRFWAQLKKVNGTDNSLSNITSIYTLDHNGNAPPATAMGSTSEAFLGFLEADQTLIKRGDKIRLEVRFQDLDNESISVDHDPSGTSERQLKVLIPFRIDQ